LDALEHFNVQVTNRGLAELLEHQMCAANIKQLEKAYRHPFEFISPKLYCADEVLQPTDQELIFV